MKQTHIYGIAIALTILILLGGVSVISNLNSQSRVTEQLVSEIQEQREALQNLEQDGKLGGFSFALEEVKYAEATTTHLHLGAGLTKIATTVMMTAKGIEDTAFLQVNLIGNASSTASTMTIIPEGSNDGIDWFLLSSQMFQHTSNAGNGLFTTIINSTVGGGNATGTGIFWNMGQPGIQYTSWMFDKVPNFKQVRFSASSGGGASSSLWMSVVKKKSF